MTARKPGPRISELFALVSAASLERFERVKVINAITDELVALGLCRPRSECRPVLARA